MDVDTGKWMGELSGVGAGLDSFYEYLLKAFILFGEEDDYSMFNETYTLVKQYMRRGYVWTSFSSSVYYCCCFFLFFSKDLSS